MDWAGDDPSVVELEFQITPLLTAGLYAIWGIQDWTGRVVPILFWLAAAVYFFLLVRSYANEETGLFASFAFAVLPLNVFFTRVLMPESGAAFFSIGAVYHLLTYRRTARILQYWLAVLFISLTLLSKLTNLLLLVPLLYLSVEGRQPRLATVGRLLRVFAIPVAVTTAYYAYMHFSAEIKLIPYAVGSDKWGNPSIWFDPLFYAIVLYRLVTVIFTGPGFLLLTIGLMLPVQSRLFAIWLLAAVGYVFIIATGNLHTYYQMPLIPAGAFFIGLALFQLYGPWRMRTAAFIACGIILSSAIFNLLPMYRADATPAYLAAQKLKEVDSSRSLALYVRHRLDIHPELLYYADRKGWVISPHEVSVAKIEEYRRRGVRYMVLPASSQLSDDLRAYLRNKVVWPSGTYVIFKL